ncbi:protein CNPPD1-like [Chironomus tepperi]|uniref:protein CNPPD1-like n=1 Tax=Chironomus tepperi TaxID=113505 RepID=UPI00391F4C73
MVSLFNKAKSSNNPNKISIKHQEFLKRIKKTLYYGPSNPNRMISQPLAQQVASHFNESRRNYDLNVLDLKFISKLRQQTPCSMILSMIYLERLLKSDPAYARLISPSELLLVTLMVSAKFYSDYDETEVFVNNWAYEGEMSLERLKQLEISFLNAIQWNLVVSDNEFHEKLKTVERLLALKEGLTRNWFTYTEIEMLMPTIEIAKQIIHYATVSMFIYGCSIMTIALSSIILTSIPVQLSKELSSSHNHTTDTILPNALPTDVMISFNDKCNHDNQTECTFDFDVNDTSLERHVDDQSYCNFTIDFPLSNQFKLETKGSDKLHFDIFQKYNPVTLVW